MSATKKVKGKDELDDPKTTLRLPRPLWLEVRHQAIDEGISFQAIVEKALEAYLKGGKR